VPFALTKDQLKFLEGRFPYTFFSVYKDHNHDHPIAHIETMIATRHVIDTIHDGTAILDMYGNPSSRDTFMARNDLRGRTMETLVHRETEKDYLRAATKWGPANDVTGVPRYHDMSIDDVLDPANQEWASSFGVYMFVHTGYYIPMTKIAQLLANNKQAIAKFVVHRHRAEQGELFGGEVEYVSRHGFVVQRNIQTGERYIHPSLEWMWSSTSKVWRDDKNALTWTFSKVTDDTWILDIAWCPNDLDERFRSYVNQHTGDALAAADRMNSEALIDSAMQPRLPQFAAAVVRSVAGVLLVEHPRFIKPLKITHQPFFEYLAGSVVGKQRDAGLLAELFALARRENALSSTFPTAKRFSVRHDEVAAHVTAAFISGVGDEDALLDIVAAYKEERVVHARKLMDRTHEVNSTRGRIGAAVEVAKVINDAARSRNATGHLLDFIEGKVS